jgi:hypothetical protein
MIATEPGGGGQHYPGAPEMLLRAVAVRYDGRELVTLSGSYFDDNSGAHSSDSQAETPKGIDFRTQLSCSIH